ECAFGDILSLVAISRGGLTEGDILALTQIDPAAPATFFRVARELVMSKKLGTVIDPAALATFFHVARELIASKSGPLFLLHQVIGVRAVLTEYLRHLGYSVPRACVELPYQFRAGNNIAELRGACHTLGVFSTFFSSGLEPELLDYWRLLASLGEPSEWRGGMLRGACHTLGVFSAVFSSGLEPQLLDYWRLLASLGEDGEGEEESDGGNQKASGCR
ncbi:hypothetical protein T484DRAFT_1783629, partial [Baffinella frigidus]